MRKLSLHYASQSAPGYTRRRRGKNWVYVRPNGRPLNAAAEVARINRLAIPPAWTDVWICRSPGGHIQATGRDARGRLQYRYHEDWRGGAGGTKVCWMLQ